jgi:hypothetical protein
MGKYDDIINLERPVSKHSKMSIQDRAAQFAPFAALTGYDGAIKETARLTDRKIIIDDGLKAILDNKLNIINDNLDKKYNISFTYFVPDNKKSGGKYIDISGIVRRIDKVNGYVILFDKSKIPISEIINIKGIDIDL